jgi:hypothetical protein
VVRAECEGTPEMEAIMAAAIQRTMDALHRRNERAVAELLRRCPTLGKGMKR